MVYIVIPCYNESVAIFRMLSELEGVLGGVNESFSVVVMDDCSTDDTVSQLMQFNFKATNLKLNVLSTDINLGHQQAIRQALLFVHQQGGRKAIVLDADGEDDPFVIPQMLAVMDADIVQVQRGKRAETMMFRFCYAWYNFIFNLLIGKKMSVGNYCLINEKVIRLISTQSFFHFGAFLSRLPLKRKRIVSDRRKRMGGESKMTYSRLFYHALKSFIEYGEELITLFLKLTIALVLLFLSFLAIIVYLKFFTDRAILGWASTIGAGLLACTLICAGFFVSGILLLRISQNRNQQPAVHLYQLIR